MFALFSCHDPGTGPNAGDDGGEIADATLDGRSGEDGADVAESDAIDPTDVGGGVTCESLETNYSPPEGDYYVTRGGDDSNGGQSRSEAFGTIQKGVDALSAGDTLIIGPGEYRESVSREGLGGPDADTTIRAEIPGTVTLRGDIPAPDFEKLDGYRFVYVADFDTSREIQTINELDTQQVLEEMPNYEELEYSPGTFYHDEEAGKLYLSSSDMRPVSEHRYSLTVTGTHGVYLRDGERVVIDGLAATGFSTNHEIDHDQHTMATVWGIFLADCRDCTVRNSYAYLNGRGIGTWSGEESAGGNIIENSVARANISQYGIGDTGGLTLVQPDQDEIRDSRAFLNGDYGINIRGGGADGKEKEHKSFLRRNVSWGNGLSEFKIKTGANSFHETIRSASPGTYSNQVRPRHCLAGEEPRGAEVDTVVLSQEENLDPDVEFADPKNRDYRLQANSRFRGAMPDGSDRGPFPYEENIYYVSPEGDDGGSGLSIGEAWRTLGRAAQELEAGDTLYLEPGVYSGELTLQTEASEDSPVSIRGRGTEPVLIEGHVAFEEAAHVEFRRVSFADTVEVASSEQITFHNSRFLSPETGLFAPNTVGLRVTQSTFTGFQNAAISLPCSKGAHLAGNLYDNADAVAVGLDEVEAVRHSDHNSYRRFDSVWQVGDTVWSHEQLSERHDVHAEQLTPEFEGENGVPQLTNGAQFAGGGTMGRPFGTYRFEERGDELRVTAGPEVHSVSATTANIEWFTSLPARVTFGWGTSEQVENEVTVKTQEFGSYSLTGLSADTTYYFQIKSLSVPENVPVSAESVTVDGPVLSFTTKPSPPEPSTFYVAPGGDNDSSGESRDDAWRTIQYAASQVGVGDTVVVTEGTYREGVRIRATGSADAPITFRAAAGEKVVVDGADHSLKQGFVANNKSHLRIDGFFIRNFNCCPQGSGTHFPGMAADMNFYQGEDIRISRILADGRGASGARSIVAREVEDLSVDNVVHLDKRFCMYLKHTPDVEVRNSVVVKPAIRGYLVRNDADMPFRFEANVFTDNLPKKGLDRNIGILRADESTDGLTHQNNLYFFRNSPAADTRNVFNSNTTLTEAENQGLVTNPLEANPEFQGVQRLVDGGQDRWDYPPDQLTQSDIELDFADFYSTNDEVTSRGIGLEEDRFGADGLPN